MVVKGKMGIGVWNPDGIGTKKVGSWRMNSECRSKEGRGQKNFGKKENKMVKLF